MQELPKILICLSLFLALIYAQCELIEEEFLNLTIQYEELEGIYNACQCQNLTELCAISHVDFFFLDLHIADVFIIFVASLLGAGSPIFCKFLFSSQWKRYTDVAVVIGKCMGTGVILACGYVHMLLPSTESLTSPCVPEMFNTTFPAFSYLFALIAGFFMHFLDEILTVLLDNFIHSEKEEKREGDDETPSNPEDSTVQLGASLDSEEEPRVTRSRKVVEAYVTEFAISVHSIFVGFAVGVVGAPEIEILTIALVFHQFFEGIATGGRVVDAKFSRLNEGALVFIFSISAPVGIAIGTGVASVLNTNGPTFLLVQGMKCSITKSGRI